MKNEYEEFWVERPKETHEYEIGTYHVSQIGNGHKDLRTNEHSGPCLRAGYWDYLNAQSGISEQTIGTTGNFRIGNILHEKIQEIMKINNPAVINEFPLRAWVWNIVVSGSIDTVVFTEEGVSIIDFKTASAYTLPSGQWDKNPTHFTQVYIYAYLLSQMLKLDIIDVSVVYISKHNLAIYKQTEKYDADKARLIYTDFIMRCFYLDRCLIKDIIPEPECMKWCKYCSYMNQCVETGGVEKILNKNGSIKSIEVLV